MRKVEQNVREMFRSGLPPKSDLGGSNKSHHLLVWVTNKKQNKNSLFRNSGYIERITIN